MTTTHRIAHDTGKHFATQKAPRPKRSPHADRYADQRRDEMAELIAELAEHFNGARRA